MTSQFTGRISAALLALGILSSPALSNAAAPVVDATGSPAVQATDRKSTADDPAGESELRFASITISGRATTWEGQSVSGARVFLGSASGGHSLVAETKTDAQGNYRFANQALPIERSDRAEGHDRGSFEIFAWAENLGIAWRTTKGYYPDGMRRARFIRSVSD